ncbi:Extragenic suppressor of kinetochore protein 1 [Choanephora cucurbitarum]|uniref:Extragenic suppressor of kinetochore protein 1 n=1 Tax=Choanephora cucurbitarum TaxID=101091 RepID=A0A1C7N6P2_9FUNG|nr:Extragenic suppressor of kinetochore protein 1 [Choanephora cucurbitarum]
MFWRFGFNSNSSAITTLLEKKDVKLEEVLADPDIIHELKSNNTKLITYLSKRESLLDLVSLFFSLEGDRHKLPLIACEILASEIPQITDAIVIDHRDVLQAFWNFLNVPYSPEPTYAFQSSYFLKIITVFITKRTNDMLCFVKSSPYHLDKILSHLQDASIMELLLSLVRLEELPEAKGIVQWLYEHELLINLVHRLDPHLDSEEHQIAQQCLSEIVKISQTSLVDSPSIRVNPLITQLTSKDMIETMMRYMLDRQAPGYTSTIMHCVSLLIDMIRHNNSDLDQQTPQNEPDFFVSLSDLLQVITAHIEPLNQILLDRDRKTVGLDRLKICELYAELLHCSNMSSLQSEHIGDDFKSACHQHQVISIMIVKQAKLTDRIVDTQEENDRVCAEPKGTRLGHMGYLTCIADEIIRLFEGYPESVLGAIKDTIDLDRWYAYCDHQLKETKARDSIPLGQHAQTPHDEKLEDDVVIYDASWPNIQPFEPVSVKKDLDPFSVTEDETIYKKEEITAIPTSNA